MSPAAAPTNSEIVLLEAAPVKTGPDGSGAADGAAVPTGTGTTTTGASGAGAGASNFGHSVPVHGTTGSGRTPVGFGACGW